MKNRQKLWFALMILVMVLSACAPKSAPVTGPSGQGPNPQTPSGGMVTKENAPFAVAAKTALSQKLNIPVDKVGFVSADLVEWTDSCLGLGGPAESCLQVITPGYKVILSAGETQYEIHTDETGSIVRLKPD